MYRSRGALRKTNAKKAERKQYLARSIYGSDYYPNLHQYSKGKIHCSCPLCRGKTALDGPNTRDRRKLAGCEDQMLDLLYVSY